MLLLGARLYAHLSLMFFIGCFAAKPYTGNNESLP